MDESTPLALDEADYVRAQRLHVRHYYRTHRPRRALLAFAVVWALFTWATWGDPPPLAPLVHFGVPVILLLPLANIIALGPLAARRAYRGTPALARPVAYAWSERGLRVSGAQGSWETAWADYSHWTEDAALILVYTAPNAFQIIPKRALDPAGEASLRRDLARIAPPQTAPQQAGRDGRAARPGTGANRVLTAALLGVTFVVWLPALLFATAFIVANAAGCTLSEARVLPCVILGVDFGAPLTAMGILGWVVLAFLPFMGATLLACLGWAAASAFGAVRRRLAARRAEGSR